MDKDKLHLWLWQSLATVNPNQLNLRPFDCKTNVLTATSVSHGCYFH